MKPERQQAIEFYVLRWLMGFVDIADGIVEIFTLGFVWPNWSFKLIIWQTRRQMQFQKQINKNKELKNG
jgi:hypothetical protein